MTPSTSKSEDSLSVEVEIQRNHVRRLTAAFSSQQINQKRFSTFKADDDFVAGIEVKSLTAAFESKKIYNNAFSRRSRNFSEPRVSWRRESESAQFVVRKSRNSLPGDRRSSTDSEDKGYEGASGDSPLSAPRRSDRKVSLSTISDLKEKLFPNQYPSTPDTMSTCASTRSVDAILSGASTKSAHPERKFVTAKSDDNITITSSTKAGPASVIPTMLTLPKPTTLVDVSSLSRSPRKTNVTFASEPPAVEPVGLKKNVVSSPPHPRTPICLSRPQSATSPRPNTKIISSAENVSPRRRTENAASLKHKVSTSPLRTVTEIIRERERTKTSPHLHQPGGLAGVVGPRRIDGLSRSGKEEPKALESTTRKQWGRNLSRAKTCSSIEMRTSKEIMDPNPKTNEQERTRHVTVPKNEKDDVHRQKTNEEQKKRPEPVPEIPSLNLTDLKSKSTANQSCSPIKATESKQPSLEHRSYSNIQSEAGASTHPGTPTSSLPSARFSSQQYTPSSTRAPTPVASARIKNGPFDADRPARTSITTCGELRRRDSTTQGENVGQVKQALIALLERTHHVPKQFGPEARRNTTTASTREASMIRTRTDPIGTKISADTHSDTINSMTPTTDQVRNRPRAATIGHNAEGDVHKSTPQETPHCLESSSGYEKRDEEKNSTKRRTISKKESHSSTSFPSSQVEESGGQKKRDSRYSIANESLAGVLSKSPMKQRKQTLPIIEPGSAPSKVKRKNEKREIEKLDSSQFYSEGERKMRRSYTWIPCLKTINAVGEGNEGTVLHLHAPSRDSTFFSSQSKPKLMRSLTAVTTRSSLGDITVASKNTLDEVHENCEHNHQNQQQHIGDAHEAIRADGIMQEKKTSGKTAGKEEGEESQARPCQQKKSTTFGSPAGHSPVTARASPKTALRIQGATKPCKTVAFQSSVVPPHPGDSNPMCTECPYPSQFEEKMVRSSPADASVPRIIVQEEGHSGKPSHEKDTLHSPHLESYGNQKKNKSHARGSNSSSFARDLDHGAVDHSNASESSKNPKEGRTSRRLLYFRTSTGLQDGKPIRMIHRLPKKSATTVLEEEKMPSLRISSENKGHKRKHLSTAWNTITRRRSARNVSKAAASEIFNRFANTMNVADTQSAFKAMGQFADLDDDDEMYPFQRLAARCELPRKAKQVWQHLIAQLPTDDEVPKLKGYHVVVVGAGPCGLRAALCLATQGAHVTVLEKRTAFTRKNRLHIWEWVRQDLISWNAKVFNPPGPQFGMDQDYCHIGIYELQLLLLKNCFLLGVEVAFGQECISVIKKTHGVGWILETMDEPLECDIVIGADGPASKFSKLVPGMGKTVEMGLKNAIGLVVNFSNEKKGRFSRTNQVRQFSWSKQFNQKLFKDLRETWNANLENIVYYRGPETHYLVMTPTSCTLENNGICHTFPIGPNTVIDHERLRAFARTVGNFFGFPADIPFLGDDENGNPNPDEGLKQDCMLFDFSSTKRAQDAIVFTGGSNAPAALVGDAALEPFWPEGLGIVRGFFSVLDCCHSLTMWASQGEKRAQKDAYISWASLKSLNGHNRKNVVMPDSTQYTMDPRTRYRGFS